MKNNKLMKENRMEFINSVLIEENSVEVEENNSLRDTISEDKKLEFNNGLESLKEKVKMLRDYDKKALDTRLEVKELANDFVDRFRNDKVELGKAVSWLGDVYRRDELASILENTVTKSEFGKNSLDEELKKVPQRLDWGLQKPQLFSDDRVSNLVHVLQLYENSLKEFDSIEINDKSNCLDKNKYLIDPDLHNCLINGFKLKRDRTINKQEHGIYMVVFKPLKVKEKTTLIYKYIKYPYIFYDLLIDYVSKESSSLIVTNDNSVGTDYLFVMENVHFTKEEVISKVVNISNYFKYKYMDRNSRSIFPRNIVDMFKVLLQGCPIFMNHDEISEFIKLSGKRDIYGLLSNIVNLYDFYKNESGKQEEGLEILRRGLDKIKFENYNFLGRVIFITDDLDSLVKKMESNYDGGISQGFQKWRGQSDSLSHTIDSIDTDFRGSMNRHNQYHVNEGNISRNSLIGRSKFSYQNIHLNLGNVRWYSTTRYVQPVLQDQHKVFFDIEEYLKKSPINCDTQLKIENALYNHSYISLTEKISKSDKPVINYKLLNKKFSNLLLEDRVKLLDYIERSRNIFFNEEPTKVNDYMQYLLSCVLKELKDEYIISVIYGRLFKIVSKYDVIPDSNKAVDVFVDIGRDLVESYFYNLYKKHIKEEELTNYKLSDWKKDNSNIVVKYDDTARAQIGGQIINWLKLIDLIKVQLITKGKKERENVIMPTERVLSVLDKEIKIKPLPRRLPMIVKPRNYSKTPYSKEVLGGYLLNNEKYVDPLIIPKWNFGKPTLIKDENLVYDLVNNINSVGFKVNKDVLEFISIYGSRYNLVINSSYVHPLSKKDSLTKPEYVELHSFLSKKDLQDNILDIAHIYSHVHEFFIPTRLDSRGRLYCISEYLNYQSTELAKALLLFSNAEKLYKSDTESINYLKAYGANCFGNKLDKMSWKNRCKWVDDNVEKIISFRDGELIEKSEKKLLFIAFCFEYNRYLDSLHNDKVYFETYLPIQLDATCNGYQHLSLLSLDHDLAKELNLTKSSWEEEPKDFYNFMAVKLINYFKDRLTSNSLSKEEKEIYTRFSQLTIARKIVKKVIMTIPYNVTHLTIIDYLKSNFTLEESGDSSNKNYYFKEDNTIILKETDFPVMAKGLKIVLFDDRFKLKNLLKYLNEVAKVVTNLDLPISWGTPDSGVLIEQSYLDTKEERLKVFAYTKKTFKIKVADKSKYNKRKQRVSFLPNFIHSLDAAALALLVSYYFTDKTFSQKNIYTIHDCFAVTANNVKILIYLLSHVYQKIYTEKNYLREFDQKMIEFIKYNCKKDIHFNKDTLVITTKEGTKLQYPSVEDVLGINCNSNGLIKESPYLIH